MKKHFLFLSALALFLSSCEIFSPLSEKTGSISIKMPEGSERIAETYDVNEITSFTAELYDSGSSPVAKVSSAPGKSITFESLTPGSYAIVIKAFKPTSKEFAACGEKSGIIVKAGATTYETITLKWVITDWTTLSAKLNNVKDDVGNVYVSGDFEIASTISFSGTAKIIPTGSVTFTRSADYKIFDIASGATLTFAGTDSAPIVFDGNSISSKNPMIYSSGTLTLENCTLQNAVNSSTGSCGAVESSGTTNITNCTFTSNTGSYGGAVQIYSGTVNISSITCSRNFATSGNDIYNYNGTLNIGGTVSSIDIYMNNSLDAYSPVLVPAQGITLASGTDPINVQMYSCSEGTAVLTKPDSITDDDFANAVKCFTLKNDGFVIDSNGKAATTYTVTFNLNYDGSTNTTQSVTSGAKVEEPNQAPTREGYTFAGWYTDTACTGEYDFSGVVTKNITLYAKWIEVITDWETLYTKLNDKSEDLGNVYVMGDFFVTVNKIIFYGTANIVSTGTGATFTRGTDFTDDFFYLNPKSLTFKGSESAPIVFDGNSETQTSNLITNGGTTTFEYCSFKNNSSSNYASVYLMDGYNTSKTTFKSCTFTGNTGYKGGAVYVGEKDTVSFENCTFETNTASDCGGAVYIKPSATATFSNCTFNSNTAIYYGGAVYIERSGTGSFSDCTFEGNSATHTTSSGGAICSSGTADITNCKFTSNSATRDTGYGGAINIDSGTMTISSITCSENTAGPGSDIYNSNGILNIGGTIGSSVDIYMYNTTSNTSQALVPVKGITLADETYPINVEMYKCSAETTVLTQSAGMSNEEFAAAIKCFTLKNARFVIGSDGKAVSTGI